MIDLEKKIAEITLKKLTNKSWSKLSLDDVLVKNIKKKKIYKYKKWFTKKLKSVRRQYFSRKNKILRKLYY